MRYKKKCSKIKKPLQGVPGMLSSSDHDGSFVCTERKICWPDKIADGWNDLLHEHRCRTLYPLPVFKHLEGGPAGTDLNEIHIDPRQFVTTCGEFDSIFDELPGCHPRLEAISYLDHEIGHLDQVEKNSTNALVYRAAVARGILRAGKNPTPAFVRMIENLVSDEIIDRRLYRGVVRGQYDHALLCKWIMRKNWTSVKKNTSPLMRFHFALEDGLSGGALGIDDAGIELLKKRGLQILQENQGRLTWIRLFEKMAELMARNFDENDSGNYKGDVDDTIEDISTISLPPELVESPDFTPELLYAALASASRGGKPPVDNASPVGTPGNIPVEILLLYYEQYTRNVKFGHVNRPGWQKTWRGSELWSPEKEKIDIGSTLQHPVFLPKGTQIQPAILPYVDMRTRSDDIETAPLKPSSQRPNLFVLQDESSSMGPHLRGSRTWYRIIGSLTAIQSAVNANLKCCVMGFSADTEYHVNGERCPDAYWLKDMAKLRAACVHHFNGNDTMLPAVARIVETSPLPVLTLFATDGEIKNLGSSNGDLMSLTRGSNHLCVFLLSNEAANNKKFFMDINAEIYTPTDLDEFLAQMNACTNKVYG